MLRILAQSGNQLKQCDHAAGPLEIGRGPRRTAARLTVEDLYVSRDHVLLEEVDPGRLKIENISRKNPVEIEHHPSLATGASRIVDLPVRIHLGQTTIAIEGGAAVDPNLQTIRRPIAVDSSFVGPKLRDLGKAPSAEVLTQWLERIFTVQQAAAGSAEFYQEAARAMVDIVGLTTSCVLLRAADGWEVAARCPPGRLAEREFSRTVLTQVLCDRRTFYRTYESPSGAHSLAGIETVIASPIFDQHHQVLGVLYGSREQGFGTETAISDIEAHVVQLLAAAIGAGLARMEREAQAMRMRVQFEQFFSSELARELERDPGMLDGRQREISVMFTDLRGFSAIAEQVGAAETFRLMSDVMDRLTARIAEHAGVVIDYYGDGVAVMWNAPADQPRHAQLAARTALALRSELPDLNESWSTRLGALIDIGIGIHTGAALVGNCGSRRRLKYGPRGHVVNLASRIEQATKQFGTPILLSGETAAALGNGFRLRRLCRARLAGVRDSIDLFELQEAESAVIYADRDTSYGRALGLYEKGKLTAAVSELEQLADDGDAPSKVLLASAQKQIGSAAQHFDGVVELTTK